MSERDAEHEQGESLISHLIELRSRLLKAAAAVLFAFMLLIPFAKPLYTGLARPLLARLPAGSHMVAIDVATPFLVPIKLAFFTALIAMMPVVLYQLWAFVAPGLYRNEQRLARPILVSATALFYVGCAFAYFLVLPAVFGFLVAVAPEGVTIATDLSHYLDFVLALFLAFGLCFEIPVAIVILVALGVVTPDALVKNRPYVIVGVFVVAAVLTPPDVVSQLMLAIPMCALFEVGVLAARALARRRADTVPGPNTQP
jgi:sec-independent protein translocase protein TatC